MPFMSAGYITLVLKSGGNFKHIDSKSSLCKRLSCDGWPWKPHTVRMIWTITACSICVIQQVQRIAHQKSKVVSFIQPQVVPNLYEFLKYHHCAVEADVNPTLIKWANLQHYKHECLIINHLKCRVSTLVFKKEI